MAFKVALKRFNPLASNGHSTPPSAGFLFPHTDPAVDGDECEHDCDTCTVHYPRKFAIDETDRLYGEINGWSRHLIVATGKSDWVRDVADESGSVMEAVGRWKDHKGSGKGKNTKLMLSASNMPLPDEHHSGGGDGPGTRVDVSTKQSVAEQQSHGTDVLLLPSFAILGRVTPAAVPALLDSAFFSAAPSNTSALAPAAPSLHALPDGVTARPCPHDYLILLCSQKTRDARCGQSAPLLKREFERHLKPLGLNRDLDDERPGGVGIYFISHVGGHKYSANVLIYRSDRAVRAQEARETNGAGGEADAVKGEDRTKAEDVEGKEAAQCIWLARVRPEDCENIVRYTVLKGKVVKPERQLRGGFDRVNGKVSW